jgi:hypothetical protein
MGAFFGVQGHTRLPVVSAAVPRTRRGQAQGLGGEGHGYPPANAFWTSTTNRGSKGKRIEAPKGRNTRFLPFRVARRFGTSRIPMPREEWIEIPV